MRAARDTSVFGSREVAEVSLKSDVTKIVTNVQKGQVVPFSPFLMASGVSE